MDPKSEEYFNKILKKDSEELDEVEKIFLRARSPYLKKAQLKKYESILKPNPVKDGKKKYAKKEK